MITVYKYPLTLIDIQSIVVPSNHKVLCMQLQYNTPTLWIEVDTTSPLIDKVIIILGTGKEYPPFPVNYIGTFQELDGKLVWHIFEKLW
jgi:hypothetical protein